MAVPEPVGAPDAVAARGAPRAAGAAAARRAAGRPRTAVLSRERIVAGALALIDEDGPDGFSMAVLADRLGVRPSSLYNHTAGRDDILAGVQELVIEGVDDSMFGELDWAGAVTAWARGFRDAFVAHPHTVALFATAPVSGMHRTLQMYERIVTAFEDAGWPRAQVIPTLMALESFLLGSALDAAAQPAQLSAGTDAPTVPRFTAAVAARDRAAGQERRSAADLSFEAGLRAMVAGFSTRLDALRT